MYHQVLDVRIPTYQSHISICFDSSEQINGSVCMLFYMPDLTYSQLGKSSGLCSAYLASMFFCPHIGSDTLFGRCRMAASMESASLKGRLWFCKRNCKFTQTTRQCARAIALMAYCWKVRHSSNGGVLGRLYTIGVLSSYWDSPSMRAQDRKSVRTWMRMMIIAVRLYRSIS